MSSHQSFVIKDGGASFAVNDKRLKDLFEFYKKFYENALPVIENIAPASDTSKSCVVCFADEDAFRRVGMYLLEIACNGDGGGNVCNFFMCQKCHAMDKLTHCPICRRPQ